ncbi:hypothetical protein SNE40_021282 [Patella caerulea]|uniref:Uncharacterized protein n=1 Tax=Patella caerulea TaxID=87958 RepID=A0AAN8GIL0_PATCE
MAKFRHKSKQCISDNSKNRDPDINNHVNKAVPGTSQLCQNDSQRRSKRLRGLEAQIDNSNVSSDEMTTDQNSIPFHVKFPWHQNRQKVRKRTSTAVSRYRRELNKVHDQNYQLQRKVYKLEKRLQRKEKTPSKITPAAETVASTSTASPNESDVITPIKKSDELLRANGFSPRKVGGIRKTLILHHSMVKHLEDSGKKACKTAINSVPVKRSQSS